MLYDMRRVQLITVETDVKQGMQLDIRGELTKGWRILCNTLINCALCRFFHMGTNYYVDFSQVSWFHTCLFLCFLRQTFMNTHAFLKRK